MLDQLKPLKISDLESRMNAEFCEPCLLVQEGRTEEGISAFSGMLQRYRDAFQENRFRYLYEDIQCRTASALVFLSRFAEALPILLDPEDCPRSTLNPTHRRNSKIDLPILSVGRV